MQISEQFTVTGNKQWDLFQILKQKNPNQNQHIKVMLWSTENAPKSHLKKPNH